MPICDFLYDKTPYHFQKISLGVQLYFEASRFCSSAFVLCSLINLDFFLPVFFASLIVVELPAPVHSIVYVSTRNQESKQASLCLNLLKHV